MRSRGYYIILLILLVAALGWYWLHQRAGFTFPLPWPDEVVFYYAGRNFWENGSFLIPELNPDRVLRWFPPGFAVVFGLIQAAIGDGSFWSSRQVIGVLMLEAFLMLGLFCWQLRSRYAAIFLVLASLYSMHSVLAGNIVRPEALVMMLLGAGIAAAAWRKEVFGFALIWLAPLIHPVSAIGVVPISIFLLFYFGKNRQNKDWWQWLVLGFALAFWQLYLLDAYQHWGDVVTDLSFQVNNRDFGMLKEAVRLKFNIIGLGLSGLLLLIGLIRKQRLIGLLALSALGLLLIRIVGQGYWYGIYRRAGLLLMALALLELLNLIWLHYFKNQWQIIFIGLSVLVLGEVMIIVGALNPNYTAWTWEGMAPSEQKNPYLSFKEINEVSHQIDSISKASAPGYIVFYPAGDMCFFSDLMPDRMKPIMPVFTAPVPSIVVYHNSKWHTDLMKYEGLEWMRQYLPYINNAHAFSTKEGTNFTIFILQPQPSFSYRVKPEHIGG